MTAQQASEIISLTLPVKVGDRFIEVLHPDGGHIDLDIDWAITSIEAEKRQFWSKGICSNLHRFDEVDWLVPYRPPVRRLLIVACSDRKKTGKDLTALERYDGPLYQILRKLRDQSYWAFRGLDVLILSAKYGLIEVFDRIDDYDQRMTATRAVELLPQVNQKLDEIQQKAPFTLCQTRYSPGGYSEIMVALGKDYRVAVADLNHHFPEAKIVYTYGGIGQQNAQVKEWIISHPESVYSQTLEAINLYRNGKRTSSDALKDRHPSHRFTKFPETVQQAAKRFVDPRLDCEYDRKHPDFKNHYPPIETGVYTTPGTRQKWRTLQNWWHITQFHFEAKPDGTHRCNPDTKGGKSHIEALLQTELIEQCDDRALLEAIHQFFNSKTRNNSAFRLPSREQRGQSPNGQLCCRLHNQLDRLKSGKSLRRVVSKAEIAAVRERFKVGTRVQGPDPQGNWKHGVILQIHKKGTQLVVRFDDLTFNQRSITKFIQDGFTESDAPAPEPEVYRFEVGDQVVVRHYRDPHPGTVAAVNFPLVTARFEKGDRVYDASELSFWFEPNHPYPELYLVGLEQTLHDSLKQLDRVGEPCWSPGSRGKAGKWVVPTEAQNEQNRERLEQEQETLIAKARCFAEANGIEIDGSGDRWVLHPRRYYCPLYPIQIGDRVTVRYEERDFKLIVNGIGATSGTGKNPASLIQHGFNLSSVIKHEPIPVNLHQYSVSVKDEEPERRYFQVKCCRCRCDRTEFATKPSCWVDSLMPVDHPHYQEKYREAAWKAVDEAYKLGFVEIKQDDLLSLVCPCCLAESTVMPQLAPAESVPVLSTKPSSNRRRTRHDASVVQLTLF